MIRLQDFIAVLPMVVLFAVSLIPLLVKVSRGNREPAPLFTLGCNLVGLIIATGITAALAGADTLAFDKAIVLDGISVWSSGIVYVIAAFCLMLSYDHILTKSSQFAEFAFLMMSSVVGMVILIMSNDLIVTFIGIETFSLCIYILVAMSKEQILSKEASFKYFVLGSFASAIFLYGIALIYGAAGTTYISELMEAVPKLIATNRVFLAGASLVVLGFAFKVSVFPFHAWTPDAYQGAPTPVTAFMATASKTAAFVAFLRFFNTDGFIQSEGLYVVLTWLAVLTMFIGNVAAIMQNNFKRVLAYSSVAHSGYLMIGIVAAAFGTNFDEAATSVLFYLFTYSVMTLGSFALVGLFEKHENTSLNVDDLKGLGHKYPVLSLSLTVLMLSLAGIPPTLGFFGKFYIFSAAIEQDMYWLAFWGVINSAISVYYYLRPVVVMYFSEEAPADLMRTHMLTRATVLFTALIVVVMGIFWSPVLTLVKRSVLNFF